MSPSRRGLAFAIGVVTALAACTDSSDSSTSSTVALTTTTVAIAAPADGQLTIGVLLPAGNSLLTEPIEHGVDVAVAEINAAGGVLDRPVRMIIEDEGDTATSGRAAVRTLLEQDVDAIVGPSSSLTALAALDLIVSAGKVACSPTASAMALDGFPDSGLFFRTVPSDSLQAVAIAQAAEQTGAQQATIVHVDDVYGRSLAAAVAAQFRIGAITDVDTVPVPAETVDYDAAVDRIDLSQRQVLVVLANADTGARILQALGRIDTDDISSVVVNDPMRDVTTAPRIRGLDADFRAKVLGLSPHAEAQPPADPYEPAGPFAVNAYDCANLIALAAVRAGSDAPRTIADVLVSNTVSGSACRSYAECVDSIRSGLQVDYDGPTGVTDLQPGGDPGRALFDVFTFDADGRSALQRQVTVSD